MYINQFEITGTPKFYAKGTEGHGEFYLVDNLLCYFPYTIGTKEIPLPVSEDGTFAPITAKAFFHSEEYEESIECCDCGETFGKILNLSFLTITSFAPASYPTYLGNEKPLPPCNGVIMGDVQSTKAVDGKDRSFYMARLAVKDSTSPIGFSYTTVSSLHPFTVDKGDRLCSKGKLVSTERTMSAICPKCGCANYLVNDSIVLQASSVQSLNTPRGYFGDDK